MTDFNEMHNKILIDLSEPSHYWIGFKEERDLTEPLLPGKKYGNRCCKKDRK